MSWFLCCMAYSLLLWPAHIVVVRRQLQNVCSYHAYGWKNHTIISLDNLQILQMYCMTTQVCLVPHLFMASAPLCRHCVKATAITSYELIVIIILIYRWDEVLSVYVRTIFPSTALISSFVNCRACCLSTPLMVLITALRTMTTMTMTTMRMMESLTIDWYDVSWILLYF